MNVLQKHLIRICKKQHKNCSRLIGQKIELKTELDFMERACEGAAEMYKDLKTAKDHIKKLLDCLKQDTNDPHTIYHIPRSLIKEEDMYRLCNGTVPEEILDD